MPIVTRSPLRRGRRVCTALLVSAHDPQPPALPCPGNSDAALQTSSLVAERTANRKPISAYVIQQDPRIRQRMLRQSSFFFFSRPAGGTLSFLCAEGAAPQFFQGACSIFLRPTLQAYPLFFSVRMNYVTVLLKGERFDGGPIFDAPGGGVPPAGPSLPAAPQAPRAPGTGPAPSPSPRPAVVGP